MALLLMGTTDKSKTNGMKRYLWIKNPILGRFISRPNRFTAFVELNKKREKVYLPDPGRLEELLIPHTKVILEKRRNTGKTHYDLLLAETLSFPDKKPLLVSVDSRLPNLLFKWLLDNNLLDFFGTVESIKPEPVIEAGRLDFYLVSDTGKHYIELKSVNLVDSHGIARFPDAPTMRGSKHLKELIRLKENGFHCWLFFMVVRKDALIFRPFYERDNAFFDALLKAQNKGVKIKALKFEAGIEISYLGEIETEIKKSKFSGFWPG